MTQDRPRLSRRKRALFAAALVIAPLLLLEFLFRLTGAFAPDEPFTIVRDDRGVELIQYNWNPIQPRFTPDKIPGALRVMVLGESTALGFPYQPRSSFGEMLRVMLEQSLPGLQVEMINLGKVGMNSSEVAELMPLALNYNPDLVIVYSGHNEFISLRNPASFLAGLGRRLGRIRLARAAGAGIQLVVGAVMLSVQEEIEEAPLAPPAPDRVSARDFDNVVARYRKNLEAMAAVCKEKNLPLVLNTLASNLAGWPPEERVFPAGMNADDCKKVAEALARDKKDVELTQKIKFGSNPDNYYMLPDWTQAPGYAPLTFWQAKMRELSPPYSDQPVWEAEYRTAQSEEAHTVTVHRAPPELNQVVRQVAKNEGAWLVENEPLSFEPQLFDDHCHPTLEGQRRIAVAIYDILKAKDFPRPAVEWAPLAFDLPAYLASHQLDATFLHNIRVRLAVFLGLERDLPFRSELTRRQLDDAIATDPADPLPALLLAAVDLHYGDTGAAAAALKPWANRPDRLRLALDRYFTRAADLRDGVILFHIEPDPTLPPLRGMLTTGIIDQTKPRRRDTEPKPRSYYNAAIKL